MEDGVRRITRELADGVVARLRTEVDDIDDATHAARVGFKRLRALLRMVRGGLDRDVRVQENIRFRDSARRLSAARDTVVMVETFQNLIAGMDDPALAAACEPLIDLLTETRNSREREKRETMMEVAAATEAARERAALWPISGHGFSIVSSGLRRSYRIGRNGMRHAVAEPSAASLHEWRKQVKYLWYQLSMLRPMRPHRLKRQCTLLRVISEHLSDHHDLAMLRERLAGQPVRLRRPASMSRVLALIDARCHSLEAKAHRLGREFYVHKASEFVRHLHDDWHAWRT
ncbi:MAG TPA: CHAD domain-containing protein [Candidatus Kapabacteria bacterium]|nr:CHAD domain-containing protein [Candidatus Kapabacteria bacterium]